jgi:bifunctional pyridoxal-dependent enzyme with beta-cystathionase and maltose regulon repressor activities
MRDKVRRTKFVTHVPKGVMIAVRLLPFGMTHVAYTECCGYLDHLENTLET